MSEPSASQSTEPRWSAYGNAANRMLRFAVDHWPRFLEWPVLHTFTVIYYLISGKQRRAVRDNLRLLLGGGFLLNSWRTYVVFKEFGWACVDSLRVRNDPDYLHWEIDGKDIFDRLTAEKGGTLVMTAHMGNYDVAAAAFQGRFPRTFHLVRTPERDPAVQQEREKEWQRAAGAGLQVHYNRPDSHLGIELARALAAGDFVGIQGDRVLFDVSATDAEVDGLRLRLPKGPFILAAGCKVPIYPLFVTRVRRRCYRITLSEPLKVDASVRGRPDPDVLAGAWAVRLLDFVRGHWQQWFVFEPALERVDEPRRGEGKGG